MSSNIQLVENQRFRQKWIVLLILAFSIFISVMSIRQFVYHIPFGNHPATNSQLAGFLAFFLLILVFLFSTKLATRYTSEGIFYQMKWIHLKEKFIDWKDIKSVEVRTYKPIKEYGGWGLRLGIFGKGKAINMSGNKGVQLILNNGRKLLIGTQKPEEIKQYLIGIGKLN